MDKNQEKSALHARDGKDAKDLPEELARATYLRAVSKASPTEQDKK